MPSAVSSQNNYYAAHHRRQSSQSQTNLPDQIRNSPSQAQSPNRSLVFLPSTAYSPSQPVTQRSRNSSFTTASKSNPRLDTAPSEDVTNDPHEFYRQYQDPFTNSSPVALHQEAIRTTALDNEDEHPIAARKSSFASAQSDEDKASRAARNSVGAHKLSVNTQRISNGNWDNGQTKPSTTMPNVLRSRKTSFKDLVARFDASPGDVPSLPTQQISRPASRTASPMPYAPMDTSHSYGSSLPQPKQPASRLSESSRRMPTTSARTGIRAPSNDKSSRPRGSSSTAGPSPGASNPEAPEPGRKLLFGEVLLSTSNVPAAGYGIYNARRRRGSEGSPMHSPNPMFPSNDGISQSQREATTRRPQSPSQSQSGRKHRRANSDFTGPQSKTFLRQSQSPSLMGMATTSKHQAEPLAKSSAQSRIPVSTRHHRMASDSATISSANHPAIVSQLPLRVPDRGQSSSGPSPSGDRKPPSPRRRPHSPMQIKSPGRRTRVTGSATGEKSPSLRANIIAPPPKISPPLRSSRPRLPVSSATTAASRAKMAEKFQTMAKQQSEQKTYRRQRPPELSDIDLKARRLKITQALSRSREGQELRGGGIETRSTSRTNSVTPSLEGPDRPDQGVQEHTEIPAVVVNEAVMDTPDERSFYSPIQGQAGDQRAFTQNALKVVEDIDSPTLGHAEAAFNSIPLTLDTHLLPRRDEQEPYSAVTEGTMATEATEATMIDAEPQTDATRLQTPGQSLLSQINTLRSQSSNSPLSSTSPVSGENSDHADEVSVHLMLRETTYLDDDEAVEKGYRPFAPTAGPELALSRSNEGSSWSSSIEDQRESETREQTSSGPEVTPRQDEEVANNIHSDSLSESSHSGIQDDAHGENYASDAYTIVNLVLQQQTPSGVVDQQLVDDIYHRIIQASPDLADAENVDEEKVVRLCLQELDEYHSQWDRSEPLRPRSAQYFHPGPGRDAAGEKAGISHASADFPSSDHVVHPPPQSYRSHKYKSSLDSAEDWAETSPSVGDWMQFALKSPTDAQRQHQQSSLTHETFLHDGLEPPGQGHTDHTNQMSEPTPLAADPNIPRPPSHSPPPPPVAKRPSIDQTWSAPAGIKSVMAHPPPPARPLTAVSQISARSSLDQQVVPSSSSTTRPSVEDQSPEHRRLKQRRHVLKELVDTEYTYERDMRVLCDIYKQTAETVISDEDIKIIFGNVELVQQFSRDFLGYLKQVVYPAYVMEKSDRRKNGDRASTAQSSNASIDLIEMTDAQKDEKTTVGEAFEAGMPEMEKVYTDYIRTRHAANKRLEALQSSSTVRQWLKECSENSTDITNAWSLDALLVKPIQRITKYPLLLHQLLEATPDTHPDINPLRRAAAEISEVNVRINEVKKHTELVDQVLNRKRKESDVRNGLTKAFGRRAEKLRQHVGINEMYEDGEYAKLKINYDNNIAHLFLVNKDCQGYIEAIKEWVTRMCELAAAAEAWVDVGHTNYAQAESKLRQFAIVVRGINSIALPDHIDQVTKRVLQPMEKTTPLLEKFKSDSKGLIQKREKRLLDYNQFKNKKDKGEKIDKKMTERMEQWEALNLEAKERMKRLLRATADLVHSCQANLLELHLNWLAMCKQKFSAAMEIPLDKLDKADIVKDWQEDFDYQEASALSLSICNGSLLADAVNMLSFLTPGSTLTGDDSPRQASWNSGMNRSVSMSNDGTQGLMTEQYRRHSGGPLSSQNEDPTDWSSATHVNGRIRAPSAMSGRMPETSSRTVAASIHTVNSANVSRPGTSLGQSEDHTRPAPRLSLETPSPSIGPLLTESPAAVKHTSMSTFYSASPGPSQSQSHLPTSGGSIFSSAMPMEDGIEPEREPEQREPRREPGVLFTAASVYEFNIDRSRQQGGFRYLTYVTGEIFDVIAEHGELWLAINQDDATREIGWIWNKHFAKLAE
ncbi:uncharacterized protein Z518_10325 [Rhinocladiella mackenziei CBS 650.93]|uniref:Dynamin-binding protein n=1 Tax=Rhinocladiella mackenziei CBS 650.93 TaxID=1442369 RepID=A0A0D2FDM6_9EURO|nr:uncharacterized protein Z518_10325 [Rhinocladiella mackenziei CBS 650.93]KIX00187.1 hypothetical protein Z518_10325 [Rhinocladiella mackenziei CBS 650.93]